MLQQFFNNNIKLWQYILVWIIFAILHALAVLPLISLPFGIILVDTFAYSVFYGVVGILLWSVIRYGNFGLLPVFQRVINYSALAVLTVVITVGLGSGFEYLVDNDLYENFLPLLPLRAFISLLIYIALAQNFRLNSFRDDMIENEMSEAFPVPDTEVKSAESEQQVKEAEEEKEILERIAVKTGQKIHVIMIPEIVYLQADGDYVHIFTTNGKYLKEQTMKYFEEHLPAAQFVRVHRSCIVNVEAISRIELYEKQNQQLTLKNGHQIKVSQAGYKLLRMKLNL
jgi:hypothetical protein